MDSPNSCCGTRIAIPVRTEETSVRKVLYDQKLLEYCRWHFGSPTSYLPFSTEKFGPKCYKSDCLAVPYIVELSF